MTWQIGMTLIVLHPREATVTWTNGFRGWANVRRLRGQTGSPTMCLTVRSCGNIWCWSWRRNSFAIPRRQRGIVKNHIETDQDCDPCSMTGLKQDCFMMSFKRGDRFIIPCKKDDPSFQRRWKPLSCVDDNGQTLLKHKQGCPTKDRPLSTKDGRLSVWHADQMVWSYLWCQPTNQGTMTLP